MTGIRHLRLAAIAAAIGVLTSVSAHAGPRWIPQQNTCDARGCHAFWAPRLSQVGIARSAAPRAHHARSRAAVQRPKAARTALARRDAENASPRAPDDESAALYRPLPVVWGRSGMRSRSGRIMMVADCGGAGALVQAQFLITVEGFCRDMIAAGYVPDGFGSVNGYRPYGTCAGCLMHPDGLALDFRQARRDVTEIPMDRYTVSKIAEKNGMFSGGDWCGGDLGHFELTKRNANVCPKRKNLYAAIERFKNGESTMAEATTIELAVRRKPKPCRIRFAARHP